MRARKNIPDTLLAQAAAGDRMSQGLLLMHQDGVTQVPDEALEADQEAAVLGYRQALLDLIPAVQTLQRAAAELVQHELPGSIAQLHRATEALKTLNADLEAVEIRLSNNI